LVLFWLLCALLGLYLPIPARAQSPRPEGELTIIPAERSPAQLRTQIVDVRMEQTGAEIIAYVDVRLTLQNPERSQLSIGLLIQGSDAIPAEAIQLFANDSPLSLKPTEPPARFFSRVLLPPNRRVELSLQYAYSLGTGPLVSFSYPLHAAWPSPDGSTRVRLQLPPGTPREAWVSTIPAPTSFDGQAIEWHFEEAAPDIRLQMQFVHPHAWAQISPAGQDATDLQDMTARMETLVALASADAPDGPAFERFYPMALAQIDRLLRADPDYPQAHLALARLYALHQDESGQLSLAYAALVAAEAQTAAQAGAPAEQVTPLLRRAYQRLLDDARAAGRWEEALAYLDKLASLGDRTEPADETRERLLIDVARKHLQDGNWAEAARIVRDTWDIPEVDRMAPPWLQSMVITVETDPMQRVITAWFFPAPGRQQEAAPQIRRAMESLQAITEAQATASTTEERIELRLVIPRGNDTYFVTLNRALANTLPPYPEWAFLAQLLRPETFRWRQTENWWRQRVSYEEVINLRPPGDVWRSYASQVEQTAERIAAEQPEPVANLIREMGRFSASSWRALNLHAQARYQVYLVPGDHAEPRQWLLLPDERRHLSASAERLLPWLPHRLRP